ADALGWMSDIYRLHGTFGVAPPHEVMPRAKEYALRALTLDPNLAEAYATLGDVQAQYERDFERARESWNRALEIDPRNTRARCERALWLVETGTIPGEDSESEVRRAVENDPLNAWAIAMLSLLLGIAGRDEESVVIADRAFDVDQGNFFAQWNCMRA